MCYSRRLDWEIEATVRLRSPSLEDVHLFEQWAKDPWLTRMVDSDLLHAFREGKEPQPGFIRIVDLDIPIGYVGLFGHRDRRSMFLETAVLSRGWGVKASRQLLALALDTIPELSRVETRVFRCNTPSLAALRNNGFYQEGILRLGGYHADTDERCDLYVFSMLRAELEQARRAEDTAA